MQGGHDDKAMKEGGTNLIASAGSQCCGGSHGVQYATSTHSNVNLNQIERVLSIVGGGLLLKRNLGRFSLPGLLKMVAGGALMRRGFTGHCNLYQAMHVSSATQNDESRPGVSEKAKTLRAAITVQMPPFETYQMWRDPANQGWIFGHFAKLESISMDRAHWTLRSPIGMKLEWDALIVADSPGEFLSWETLPGAGIPNEGVVRFTPTETGGTRLVYEMRYDPPAGALGVGLMKMIGLTPEAVIGKALHRFKTMAEMGMPKQPVGPHEVNPQEMQTQRSRGPVTAGT